MRKSVLAAVLVLLAAGCGDDDDGTRTATCNVDGADFCMAGTGPSGDVAEFERDCRDQGGTLVSSCAATDRVGRCSLSDAGARIVMHFYPPTWDATNAQDFCVNFVGGTWQPG
jgi:hypothetical protein